MYLNPSFGKVGHKLRKIRKSYGWTLQEACDKVKELSIQVSQENESFKEVKLNPAHLSKIENNAVDTSDYYIALLCEAYQVKLSEIYKDSDDDSNNPTQLLHLPPHMRDFISNPENFYLLNMAHNMKKFSESELNTIREFMRLINI